MAPTSYLPLPAACTRFRDRSAELLVMGNAKQALRADPFPVTSAERMPTGPGLYAVWPNEETWSELGLESRDRSLRSMSARPRIAFADVRSIRTSPRGVVGVEDGFVHGARLLRSTPGTALGLPGHPEERREAGALIELRPTLGR